MKRFYHSRKPGTQVKQILSIGIFLAIFCVFFIGISQVSGKTSLEETEVLTQAIARGIAHCYATEGRYPENLDTLLDMYNISYDSDKYFIDYQVLGENIFPDVTIIEKQQENFR